MFDRLLLTTMTLVLAMWIFPTTAQNETCTNGGIAQSRRHPICTCRSGFKGYDCSQRVGACEGRPCRNGGTCSENKDGTFTCTCDDKHKGILCEQRITPCDSGPCKNGGNCTDDGEKCFKCECPPGFKGSDCSETVQPCEIKPCKNNGICMNEEGGRFSCKCRQGYAGIFCEKRDDLFGSHILNQTRQILQLKKWLGSQRSWKLCYRATDNGFAASTFHARCDYKHPTVTIIRSRRYIFGAYSDIAFGGSTGYRSSSKAFLFSLVNRDNLPPFKSPVYRNSVNAVYTNNGYGPTFGGGHDLYISNSANAGTNSYTNLGHTYQPPSGYSYGSTRARNLFAGSYRFRVDEVETFYLNLRLQY